MPPTPDQGSPSGMGQYSQGCRVGSGNMGQMWWKTEGMARSWRAYERPSETIWNDLDASHVPRSHPQRRNSLSGQSALPNTQRHRKLASFPNCLAPRSGSATEPQGAPGYRSTKSPPVKAPCPPPRPASGATSTWTHSHRLLHTGQSVNSRWINEIFLDCPFWLAFWHLIAFCILFSSFASKSYLVNTVLNYLDASPESFAHCCCRRGTSDWTVIHTVKKQNHIFVHCLIRFKMSKNFQNIYTQVFKL